jgi:hypothetical protein
MNTLSKIFLATILSIIGFSEANAQWGSKVNGNGNVTTKTVNTGSYDEIKAVGFMDVHLKKGTEGTITVKAEDNLHEYVIVEVKGDALILRIKKNVNINTKKGIHITVPFQDISKVSLTGSGDVDSKDLITSENFDVSITGSGDVILAIESQSINAKVTGSGDMTLSGSAKELEVKISGSGDFMGSKLKSDNTQAYVSGSGDAVVNATKSLKARVNGSGDIEYTGNPEASDTKVLGSGSISSN